jgi:hypothetical protein
VHDPVREHQHAPGAHWLRHDRLIVTGLQRLQLVPTTAVRLMMEKDDNKNMA